MKKHILNYLYKKEIRIILSLFVLICANPMHSKNGQRGYIGAITARESLVLAVGNDLRSYLHYKGIHRSNILDQINDKTYTLYNAGVRHYKNGGWLLQPGKMKKHPDYLYAGHVSIPTNSICKSPDIKDKKCNLIPKPIDGIGMDVSHFLAKWPIFLIAYRESNYDNSKQYNFFDRLINGLEVQMFEKVLKKQNSNPLYLLTNYMDGTNGVYRWNYRQRGKNWGYNPFQLSSTLCYSSLALFKSHKIQEIYNNLNNSLPYTVTEAKLIGKNNYCNNEEARLTISLSSRLMKHVTSEKFSLNNTDNKLFRKTFGQSLLKHNSWIGDNAYTSVVGGKQIVLHSSFIANHKEWIQVFDRHFKLFTDSVNTNGWPQTSEYKQWHHLLLASRYLVLSAKYGYESEVQPELYKYLYARVSQAWEGDNQMISNIGWGEPPFKNYYEWILWKEKIAAQENS